MHGSGFFNNLANQNCIRLKKIKNALISVYYKDGLDAIVRQLNQFGVKIYSTGGTAAFIRSLGSEVTDVETLTNYPSILGGRVKTLHPKIFGGILARSDEADDQKQMEQYAIPAFDLVIVDLYPFEETRSQTNDADELIEKIDIGGISLIRAAAKNFREVLVVPSSEYYADLMQILTENKGHSSLEERNRMAACAFAVSSHYDSAIFNWLNQGRLPFFRQSSNQSNALRYGENPQQKGVFFGNLNEIFEQLHGKALSYNNLLDLDAGLSLISEFDETAFAILKHNNACGLACHPELSQAYQLALAGDPLSAFGGVLVCNRPVDTETAGLINQLFFEVIIAPDYEKDSLQLLRSKKNRVILQLKRLAFPLKQYKSVLNGVLEQDRDADTETVEDFRVVTQKEPQASLLEDLVFANKAVKHTRSNAIVLVKNRQLLASGMGQTSRVDALKQAIAKAKENGYELNGAVMASDAFFPFSDSVEMAAKAGITSIVQPGGSVRDQESIDACNKLGISMAFTGKRHFKH